MIRNQTNRKMGKVSEKPKEVMSPSVSLTVPLTGAAHENLIKIQGQRQLSQGKRTSLKDLANEAIESLKA